MYQVKSDIAAIAFTNGGKSVKRGTLRLLNTKNTLSKKLIEAPSQCNKKYSSKEFAEIRTQMQEMQMEIDILKETIKISTKDLGIDQTALTNREKAVIMDALKNKYSLPLLLKKLNIAKNSYYFQ